MADDRQPRKARPSSGGPRGGAGRGRPASDGAAGVIGCPCRRRHRVGVTGIGGRSPWFPPRKLPDTHVEATPMDGLYAKLCPATSYSPTTSRLQYHRR